MNMISVIVPVYGVEPYLRCCVDSILAQTFREFELILVDDGSPDRCGEICDEYAMRDGRVRVVHQSNAGLSAARNAGLEMASGEWIAFVDSDDWVGDTYLMDLLKCTSDQCPIGIAETCLTDGTGPLRCVGQELKGFVSPQDVYDKCDLLAVWAWGKLFRRDLIGDLRFPVGRIQEDEFFTYRILFKIPKVAIARHAVYYYRQRRDSIGGGKWRPDRMWALRGMKEQLAYFETRGFSIAARHVRRRRILWLCSALLTVRDDHDIGQPVRDRLYDELTTAMAENGELIRHDAQLTYWIRRVRNPKALRFFQVIYAFDLMRERGMAGFICIVQGRLHRFMHSKKDWR